MTRIKGQPRLNAGRQFLGVVAGAALLIVTSIGLSATPAVWGMMPGRIGEPAVVVPVQLRAQADEPDVRLAVLGDVGTGDANAWATAELVATQGVSDAFDALILLGDNAYENGDPSLLQTTVFDPFAEVLGAGAELLPVLGNHDVREGHAAGQVETLGMPGRWYAETLGSVLFVGLDSNLVDDPIQQRWLETTLAENQSEWIIVAMHHPAYSAGYHGSDEEVQEAWVPVLEQHGVDLVFAGHDHDYQRSKPIDGVTYVVSGGGAKLRPTGSAHFTAYSASVLHFVDVAVWEDRIELRAISDDGVFDTFTIAAAHVVATAPPIDEPARQAAELESAAIAAEARSDALDAAVLDADAGSGSAVAWLVAAIASVVWFVMTLMSRSVIGLGSTGGGTVLARSSRLVLALAVGSAIAAVLLAVF